MNERTILQAAHTVIDSLGAENVECLPDVLGRTLFSGVRNGTEAGADGPVEHVPEFLRGVTDLRRIESDAENHVAVRERLFQRRHRVIGG